MAAVEGDADSIPGVAHRLYFTGVDRVEVRDEPVVLPQGDQVLIQTTRTLISAGTECICLGRLFEPGSHWDTWVRYPFPPGYSLVGRVAAVGSRVDGFELGDRVAARVPHSAFATMSVERVLPIPDGVSDEEATWFGLATIVQSGVRRAEHELGDDVVVVGLGPLGQLVVQYARLQGARRIIAVDIDPRRLTLAMEHGATHALEMPVAEAREAVLDLTEGNGARVVYDVTGSARVFAAALGLLCRFGRLVLLGDTGTPTEQHLTSDVIRKGLSIVGTHDSHPPMVGSDANPWTKAQMALLFFDYLRRGDMRVGDLVSHRFAPSDAVRAYDLLRTRRDEAMGVVFTW